MASLSICRIPLRLWPSSDPRRPGAWHKLRSVEKVEDVFEQWANGAAWMGFDESNATDPGSWENLVELPMRGLHKRVD